MAERLVPSIPANSTIVIDSAFYHAILHNKAPTKPKNPPKLFLGYKETSLLAV
jgi:hypothetical protein